MRATASVQSILDRKGGGAMAAAPDVYVYDAIKLMADNGIGALLVLEDDKLVGILSERDYARKVILEGKSSKDTLVREIMVTPVQFVTPDCTVDEAMSIMTEERVRHLPVLSGGRVAGIVSIGDLVRTIVDEQAATIEHLHAYITGQYPG